jgi:hypothetical protein
MAYQVLHKKTVHHKHYRLETADEHLFNSFIRKWEEFHRYQGRHPEMYAGQSGKDYLCRVFFDILASVQSAVVTSESEESVSYKGLNEVKEEITAEVTLKIDQKCKEALAFQEANKQLAKLHAQNEVEIIPQLNKELAETKEILETTAKEKNKLYDVYLNQKLALMAIQERVTHSNFFRRGWAIHSIQEVLTNLKKKNEDIN